ncbi:MAG TPA: rhomboid family intramembrane serine protease [Pyrinomonadaceae bacterium]|nr:rhomboid family intramembrane serine protease [Pyrinomonadaceae bacterium]
MLFPIADENTDRRTTPVVNYVLIGINILVFVLFQGIGSNEKFTYAYSTVPAEIISGKDIVTEDRVVEHPVTGQEFEISGLQPTLIPVYLTLLTSMFMHGGIAHIFGNMLFLWIFGDNIEDRLGHIRYLIFYLVCGVLAGLAHVFTTVAFAGANSESLLIPSLGASGAISGVLGGYLLLFPTKKVMVMISWFFTAVPAFIAIGLWFVFQLISGLGMLGSGSQAGGVAYAAHIGGFIAGLALIKIFEIGRGNAGPIQRPPVDAW